MLIVYIFIYYIYVIYISVYIYIYICMHTCISELYITLYIYAWYIIKHATKVPFFGGMPLPLPHWTCLAMRPAYQNKQHYKSRKHAIKINLFFGLRQNTFSHCFLRPGVVCCVHVRRCVCAFVCVWVGVGVCVCELSVWVFYNVPSPFTLLHARTSNRYRHYACVCVCVCVCVCMCVCNTCVLHV